MSEGFDIYTRKQSIRSLSSFKRAISKVESFLFRGFDSFSFLVKGWYRVRSARRVNNSRLRAFLIFSMTWKWEATIIFFIIGFIMCMREVDYWWSICLIPKKWQIFCYFTNSRRASFLSKSFLRSFQFIYDECEEWTWVVINS